ncbi:MAG TPA: valine--tRNA ligase, partial [Caldilineaceae bacterium]|nr:valine--tRNA ligase [Caldilineaceae bacterium]
GYNVYYPMGFDDNGLPTERLVERQLGKRATEIGRAAFTAACLARSEESEKEYRTLWQRLGLSVDWRYTYRTIEERSRRIAQWSFLDLHRKGLIYRQEAPTLWCPECQTALAQADVDDLTRNSEFITLRFSLETDETLSIATTRPELLPACVAIFVHPDDERYRHLVGSQATVPIFGHQVPILTDANADPAKGTGAVMCCTFGDATDVIWWRTHKLPLRMIIGTDGRLTDAAGDFGGLPVLEARRRLIERLTTENYLVARQPVEQTVRVHERCDTPVETLVTPQWYVRVLDHKTDLLAAGEQIDWQPAHMKNIYRTWVENLAWDWCISRQRYYGVPFPVWFCDSCGATMVAEEAALPVNPLDEQPTGPCPSCGGSTFRPDSDVMDTWATSSLSPQLATRWQEDDELCARLYPMALRPQAHEIIRTWAFYTMVKALHHFGNVPWSTVQISGWGLAPAGMGKISKSRGGGPIAPLAAINEYSADAVRYWAASTAPGRDTVISEEKMQNGSKLVTKFWHVARFAAPFAVKVAAAQTSPPPLSLADRWILARIDQLVTRVTSAFRQYDYNTAKNETESFFWTDLADNYLEMAKLRLYDETNPYHAGACYALGRVLPTVLKLFSPILPYVTDTIYRELFAEQERQPTIHRAPWPQVAEERSDDALLAIGKTLVTIATAVRRYKSEQQLPLGTEFARLTLATTDRQLADRLSAGIADLRSIARVREVVIGVELPAENVIGQEDTLEIGIER